MVREYIGHLPLAMTPSGDQTRGEWFVSRPRSFDDYDDLSEYLHQDGMWRESTYTLGGGLHHDKPTGYFASEDDAKAALAKARGETAN